jgi:hypothetical protein
MNRKTSSDLYNFFTIFCYKHYIIAPKYNKKTNRYTFKARMQKGVQATRVTQITRNKIETVIAMNKNHILPIQNQLFFFSYLTSKQWQALTG